MITLHALDQSRSLRILWLLELLGVPYELDQHGRDPETLRAPDALKRIHPLGKAPVLQDGELVLAESGVIVDYLIQTYGNGRFMPAAGTPGYWQYQRWLHYAEGSLMPLMVLALLMGRAETAPMLFFARPFARRFTDGIRKAWIFPQTALHLGHVEQSLQGQRWLCGEALTGADVMMSFPLQAAQRRLGTRDHPEIERWLGQIAADPAWQRAEAEGGRPVL
jgi:glutathione S-transferase